MTNSALREKYAKNAEFRARKQAINKRWADKNREKLLRYYQDRYKRLSTPKKRLAARLKFQYGLTLKDAAEIKRAARGRCAVCKKKAKLVIDHCHRTGKVRGMLCYRCNIALGAIESVTYASFQTYLTRRVLESN